MTMRDHVRLIAILSIVWSAISLIIGALIVSLVGGFGLLAASQAAVRDPGAAAAPAIVGMLVVGLGIFMIVLTLPGFLAGWGLLNNKSWARILTIVLSALNLPGIPIGTALGIYGLWVMTHREVEAQFAATYAASPSLR